ncbi:MAG: response regulator [Cyanobacteria bacterium REEB65]|nr:response regulator [Cyanobacteria bacterium REEB65]
MNAAPVLLVEDVKDNRDLAQEILEAAGLSVAIACDGQEALVMARSLRPALILLDMSLPLVDGWEVLRILKADALLQEIPVIALTAHVMAGDRQRMLQAGCVDYISKPISVGSFAAAVKRHL